MRTREKTKYEIADQLSAIMGRWLFERPRKRGGQGRNVLKGQPRAMTPAVLVLMEQAFMIGCNLTEALAAGDISYAAWQSFMELNPTYTERVDQLKSLPKIQAKSSVVKALPIDYEHSLRYLERVSPDEFSLKATVQHNVEFTGISLERPVKQIDSAGPVVVELPSDRGAG